MDIHMLMGALMAKGLTDLTWGGAFLWYLVKFIVSAALAFCAIMLGIRWRKSKNAAASANTTVENTEKTEA